MSRHSRVMLQLGMIGAVFSGCQTQPLEPQTSPRSADSAAHSRRARQPPRHRARPPDAAERAASEASVWSSPEACEAALASGARAQRTPGRARIGSWNIRWFPDGHPGKQPDSDGTDLRWLACSIAWLDVDALAVQEFKLHPAALEKLNELLSRLNAHTGGAWRARFDDCPQAAAQHVGVLFDSNRLRATDAQVLDSLNPRGGACQDQLRPGFALYLRFPGGLDLNVVSLHLKSGAERRALELRQRSIFGFDSAYRVASQRALDGDLLFAGDFNSMGCAHCAPKIAASAELAEVSERLLHSSVPLRRVGSTRACSEYSGQSSTLLDYFVASASMRELPEARSSEVYGDCAERACAPFRAGERRGAFARALSDHCPIVVELDDVDDD